MEPNGEALDNQADSVDYSSEESVNAAAAKEIEAAKASAPEKTVAEQPSKTDVTKPDVAAPDKAAQKIDPSKQPTGQPAFDAEKSYAAMEKSLAETRKWATQQAQQRAALEKEIATIKAAQKPVLEKVAKDSELNDLQQLQRALQTQDPQALNALLARREQAAQAKAQAEFQAKLDEVRAEAVQAKEEAKALKYDREVERRKTDSKNYPNFGDLEPTMMKLVESGQVVWDEQQAIGDVIDHLYNLAKTQHSEEAIKLAEKAGKDKAEAELANEAKAAVAGGGKGVSTTPANLHTMPLDKLEQLAIQLHGVADRD